MADATDALRDAVTGVPVTPEPSPIPPTPHTPPAASPGDGSIMSLVDHLGELRTRLFRSVLAVAIGSAVGFYFATSIRNFLISILPTGRVRDCVVTRSSGHRDLDAATCPLLERSLRYRPARDANGRPIAETIRGQQDWQLGPEPPVREYDGEVVGEVREIRRRRF